MILVEESCIILSSLERLTTQLTQEEFVRPLAILNQNSVSQHLRHIVEFYQEYILGLQRGEIDFDERKRSKRLEEEKDFALEFLRFLKREMDTVRFDKQVQVRVSTHKKENRPILKSSSFRELAYCNEHAVHHMAILKIAIKYHIPQTDLAEGFGVAFSTQHANHPYVSC